MAHGEEYKEGYRNNARSTIEQAAGADAAERERAKVQQRHHEEMQRVTQTQYQQDSDSNPKPQATTPGKTQSEGKSNSSVSSNIAWISVFLAAFIIYAASDSPEVNLFLAGVITFFVSFITLHLAYYLLIVVGKIFEIAFGIAVYGAIIVGGSYFLGFDWAVELVGMF